MMNNRYVPFIALVIGVLGAGLFITYGSYPYIFVGIFQLWFVLSSLVAFKIPKSRVIAFNIAAVSGILLVIEFGLCGFVPLSKNRVRLEGMDSGYYQRDPIKGYRPRVNSSVHLKMFRGRELVYDATYTIGQDGLRMGSVVGDRAARSILFFGDSYTYGEGLNDLETLPANFETLSEGRVKSHNFGFHGYGPHQMLAILENHLEKDVSSQPPPAYAIYQSIVDHIGRAQGKAPWDVRGPRFVISSSGDIVQHGVFHHPIIANVLDVLSKWQLAGRFREILWGQATDRPPTQEEFDLFVGIVSKAKKIFEERYGGKFVVLLWWANQNLEKKVMDAFNKRQISYIRVQDILGNGSNEQYTIKGDGHPNALANQMIAKYLVSKLR